MEKTEHRLKRGLPAIHSGVIIQETFMQEHDISAEQLAKASGVELQTIEDLLRGAIPLTASLALKVGKSLSINPYLLLRIHADYEVWEAKKHIQLDNIEVLLTTSDIEKA